VSNQSGIARGFFDANVVDQVHRRMDDMLAAGGARIDAYYYCPHHPEGSVREFAKICECRKPARGLVDRAARELRLDVERSFVVGDTRRDIGLARAVGARGVLVRTGGGAIEETRMSDGPTPDAVVDNLAAAASWILMSHQSARINQQC